MKQEDRKRGTCKRAATNCHAASLHEQRRNEQRDDKHTYDLVDQYAASKQASPFLIAPKLGHDVNASEQDQATNRRSEKPQNNTEYE